MNWIKHPLNLEGRKIKLLPLEECHFEELITASQSKIIWKYLPIIGSDKEKLSEELRDALNQRELNIQYPFVVFEKTTKKIIGSTRLLKINEENKNLEIGWTWYLPEYWGKKINDECKFLLLTYCFEVLKTIRVQIVAAENNSHSRKAIERIGGKFEGILRNFTIRHDGKRNSAFYSIVDNEWENVKSNFKILLK